MGEVGGDIELLYLFTSTARRGGWILETMRTTWGPSERRRDGGVSIGGLRRRSGPAFRRVDGGRRTGPFAGWG